MLLYALARLMREQSRQSERVTLLLWVFTRAMVDDAVAVATESRMAGWLPLYVCRIIAILLLVLDLGLEPGSALSFVGMSDPDDGEAVADLCRQDDFWWGRKCAPLELAKTFASEIADSTGELRRGWVTEFASTQLPAVHAAIVLPDVEGFGWASSASGSPLFLERALFRNSYVAQKRRIVLLT